LQNRIEGYRYSVRWMCRDVSYKYRSDIAVYISTESYQREYLNNGSRKLKGNQNHPVYSIGVVSELLGIHPETIRTWEKAGVGGSPQRRSGKRFYSEMDYRRLQFIQKLVSEGLTMRAIKYYLQLYPCWNTVHCSSCLHSSDRTGSTKPCWQIDGAHCQIANKQNPCAGCDHNLDREQPLTAEPESDTIPTIHAQEQSAMR
jgi:DNA-binding transcriptional MerR regulator